MVVVGVAVSLLVQYLKSHFGGGAKTLGILVGLSVVAGVVGLFVQNHPQFLAMASTVLVSANAFYTFVIQFVEKE